MTKAYSGMVQEAMSFIRNIILLFVKSKNKIAKLIITLVCVTIAVVAGILINIFGIMLNYWISMELP